MSKKTPTLKTPSSSRLIRPTEITKSNQNLASASKAGKGQLAPGVAEQYATSLMKKMGGDSVSPPSTPSSTPTLILGDRVVVGGSKLGVVAFIGETKFAPGEWVGVHLDVPDGKNDGSVAGVRYFNCEALRGVFSKANKITLQNDGLKGVGGGGHEGSSGVSEENKMSQEKSTTKKPSEFELILDSQTSSGFCSEASTPIETTSTQSTAMPLPTTPTSRKGSLVTPPKKADDTRRSSTAITTRAPKAPSKLCRMLPPSAQSSTTSINAEASTSIRLRVGDRVVVGGSKVGSVKFIGQTGFAKGEWAGIELDEPIGKNDGQVEGKRYFKCPPNFGLFSPVAKVTRLSSSTSSRTPSIASTTPATKIKTRGKMGSGAGSIGAGMGSSIGGISGIGGGGMRKTGSQESVSSIGSVQSTRSGRVRLGVTGCQQPSKLMNSASQLSTSVLEKTLREKDEHLEQLLNERDFERNELAKSESQVEEIERQLIEAQNQHKTMQTTLQQLQQQLQQEQQQYNSLNNKLEEEMKKVEDLQFNLEESSIEKTELENQRTCDRIKIEDLMRKRDGIGGVMGGVVGGVVGGEIGGSLEGLVNEKDDLIRRLEKEIKKVNDEKVDLMKVSEDNLEKIRNLGEMFDKKCEEMKETEVAFEERMKIVKEEAEVMARDYEDVVKNEKEGGLKEVQKVVDELEGVKVEMEKCEKVCEKYKVEVEALKEDGLKNSDQLEKEKIERIEGLKMELGELERVREEMGRSLEEYKERVVKSEGDLKEASEKEKVVEEKLKAAQENNLSLENLGKISEERNKEYDEKLKELYEKLKLSEEKEKNVSAELNNLKNDDLPKASEELSNLRASLEKSKSKIFEKDNEIVTLQQTLDQADLEKSMLGQQASTDVQSTTSHYEDKLSVLNKEKEELSQRLVMMKAELEERDNRFSEFADKNKKTEESLNEEVRKLNSEIQELKTAIVSSEISENEMKNDIEIFKKYALDKDGLIGEKMKEVEECKSGLDGKCGEVDALKLQLEEVKSQIKDNEVNMEEIKKKENEEKKEREQEKEEREKEKEVHEKEKQKMEEEMKRMSEKMVGLEGELREKEESERVLRERLEELEGERVRLMREGEEGREMMKKTMEAHEDDVVKYQNGERELKRRIADLSEEVRLKSDSLKIFSEKTQNASDNLQTEVMQLTRQVEALKIDLFEKDKVLGGLKEEKEREMEAIVKERERLVKEYDGEKERMNEKIKEVEDSLNETLKKMGVLEEGRKQVECDLKETSGKLVVMEETLKKKEAEMVVKCDEFESRLAGKEEEIGVFEERLKEYQDVLKNEKDGALKEVQKVVGELERLKVELEKCEKVCEEYKIEVEALKGVLENKEGETKKIESESVAKLNNFDSTLLEKESQMTELKRQIEQLKSHLSSSETENTKKIDLISEECNDLKAKIESLNEENNQSSKCNGELNLKIAELTEAEKSSAIKSETSEIKIKESLEEMNALKSGLELKLKEKETLIVGLSELKASNEKYQQDLVEFKSQQSSVGSNMEEEKVNFNERLIKGEKDRDELNDSNKKLIEQNQEIMKELGVQQKQKEDSSHKYDNIRDKLSKLLEENDFIRSGHEREVKKLVGKLNDGEVKITSLNSTINQLNSTINQLNQQFVTKDEQIKSMNQTHEKEREQIIKDQIKLTTTSLDTTHSTQNGLANQEEVENLGAQVDFLNSVIVDIQKKNDALQKQLDVALDDNYYTDDNDPSALLRMQAPRMFCDICDCFDLHDTDDCPKQSGGWEDGGDGGGGYDEMRDPTHPHLSKHGGSVDEERPYCDVCEVFGHTTESCTDDQTF